VFEGIALATATQWGDESELERIKCLLYGVACAGQMTLSDMMEGS